MSKKNANKLSYEEAIERLEEIVHRLEDEDIPLEESLAFFQEGIALSRHCREKLAEIEYRVDYLLKEEREKESAAEAETAADQGSGDSETNGL